MTDEKKASAEKAVGWSASSHSKKTDSTTKILAEKESPSSSCSPEKVTTHPARKDAHRVWHQHA